MHTADGRSDIESNSNLHSEFLRTEKGNAFCLERLLRILKNDLVITSYIYRNFIVHTLQITNNCFYFEHPVVYSVGKPLLRFWLNKITNDYSWSLCWWLLSQTKTHNCWHAELWCVLRTRQHVPLFGVSWHFDTHHLSLVQACDHC